MKINHEVFLRQTNKKYILKRFKKRKLLNNRFYHNTILCMIRILLSCWCDYIKIYIGIHIEVH